MGRKILIVCVCLLCVAGAAVGFSRLVEPVPTTVVQRSEEFIVIRKEYESIEAMNLAYDTDGVPEGGYVLISSNVEDPDNARLYIKAADGYELVTDLSGATGADGKQGERGVDGLSGITPLLMINTDTGMWEVSYDLGASWESLGVQAQGPKGDTGATGVQGPKGDKGDTGATGATGAQGPAYVLTEADKQAIIDAVLEQLGDADTGGSGSDSDSSGTAVTEPVAYYYDGMSVDNTATTPTALFNTIDSSINAMSRCSACGAEVYYRYYGDDFYGSCPKCSESMMVVTHEVKKYMNQMGSWERSDSAVDQHILVCPCGDCGICVLYSFDKLDSFTCPHSGKQITGAGKLWQYCAAYS